MARVVSDPITRGMAVQIRIDKSRCTDCKSCLDACPLIRCIGFETLEDRRLRYLCAECGGCMAICPEQAISVGQLTSTPARPLPGAEQMLSAIKNRRSVRAFTERPVSEESWNTLADAVGYSPTGHHYQSIDLVIVRSREVLSKLSQIGMEMFEKLSRRINRPILSAVYRKMMGPHAYSVFSKSALLYAQQKRLLEKGEDPVLFHAPGLMLFIGPKAEMMSKTEADLAAQTTALLAPALGLGTCYSGIVTACFAGLYPGIGRLIPIPRGYAVHNALLVGYPRRTYVSVPNRKKRNVTYL